jgi:hypothetical protein
LLLQDMGSETGLPIILTRACVVVLLSFHLENAPLTKPQGLEVYTSLQKLSLASLGLKSLAGLPQQLTCLQVNDNNLAGGALTALTALTLLRRLDLAGGQTRYIATGYGHECFLFWQHLPVVLSNTCCQLSCSRGDAGS